MIACLYGRAFAPFVEPVVRDLCLAATDAGGELLPLTIEAAVADRALAASIHRLYVMPLDIPTAIDLPDTPGLLTRALFPNAHVVIPFGVQDLCWDKIATQERLVD